MKKEKAQDNNRLDSGTLGFADIDNRAEFKAQHQGFGLSSGGSIGGQFAGNMANSLLAGANQNERARGTTQSAIADGAIVVRDRANQQQDVAGLARDTEQAHQPLSPIFDKEKAQRRLQQSQLLGEIGNQVADIARTEGEIAGEKARRDPTALDQARTALAAGGKPFTERDVAQRAYNTGMRDSGFGTGGQYQQAIQAATAAVQGLAGDNLQAALAGGAAPYISEIIKQSTPDGAGRVAAHAVVNAALAAAQGNHPLAGAAGAATGEIIGMLATEMYQKPVAELSESEKQTVSALATLAAGLAGGLVGDAGASALAGAQSGKTTVENNFLGTKSSSKLDKIIEKIQHGDKTLATAKELLQLENADKRSDILIAKFVSDPTQLNSAERSELAGYLRIYAAEMETEYGTGVAQELVNGLLSGSDYLKRGPDSDVMAEAQNIMRAWGYHKSNASIGDPILAFGTGPLANSIKAGVVTNAAIGVGANTAVQLGGKDPFNYVDAILAGVTAAATTGKSIGASTAINMGGAAVGSAVKGENPIGSVIGAGAGSLAGGKAGQATSGAMGQVVDKTTSAIGGAIVGSVISERVGGTVKEKIDKAGKK
ncbi:VENN motif pre-toxin domain-containing protein [Edwardsiella anguillarum]|uniref:VENN motif pre-toxin domain-containing protein n=1 Tax=Edwardsiella anguillarum TaxID=1821960 RepID=UPI003211BCB5